MTSKMQLHIFDIQAHCDILKVVVPEPTFENYLSGMYEVVNYLWDSDLEVDRVAVTRSVADVLGLEPEETERVIWMTGSQSPLGLKVPMAVAVAELPEGMLMRAEGLVNYPVWAKV